MTSLWLWGQPLATQAPVILYPDISGLVITQKSYLVATPNPNAYFWHSLGDLGDFNGKDVDSLVKQEYPALYWIVFCESSFRIDVCSYAGCSKGMGLAQIIPSTLRYCEKKLGRTLDVFNPEDNLDCASWLLENEGLRHWESSKSCWQKYE